MEVIINGTRTQWKSHFLTEVRQPTQSKWWKKREDYFCADTIGGTKCFIKRAENGFRGASIFKRLVGQESIYIPKTYGLGKAIENNRTVWYLITEFIEGNTLDVVLSKDATLDVHDFAKRLTSGIEYLAKLGFWHTDLNAENVFISNEGKAYIIDIDSSCENHIRPIHIPTEKGGLTTQANQMRAYALRYYKKYLGKPDAFEFSKIPGVNLNYFQALFLTYQVKHFQEQKELNPRLTWMRSTFEGLKIEDKVRNANKPYADSLFRSGLIKPLHKEGVLNLVKNFLNTTTRITPNVEVTLTPKENDGKWGYIDKSGNEVIPFIYDYAWFFSEGLAEVKKDGKRGFIDKSGNEVIPLIYDDAGSFSGGRAMVEKGGKWGYIDKSGNDHVGSFSEGRAMVEKGGKWGYIDKSGNVVIPLIYDDAESFSEGLAMVRKGSYYLGKRGFIDKSGNEVIPLIYDDALDFSEGLAKVEKDGKYGYIDKSGKEVIPLIYDYAGSFSEGLAMVRKGSYYLGEYGYIDKSGKVVIPLIYDYAWPFSEGLARVKKKKWWGLGVGKYGYIDKSGKVVIPFIYDDARDFSRGLARVKVKKDGKWFYINKRGECVRKCNIGLAFG